MMFMNGEYVKTIEDLKRCLSLEELVYNYYSGELEIWLRKIGETEKGRPITAYPERQCLSSCSAVCSIWMESRTFR